MNGTNGKCTQAGMHCAPGLLDAPQMQAAFERELGCSFKDCRIVRAKLRPGRNCLLTYRLRLSNDEEQLFSLLAFGNGESAERFALAQQSTFVSAAVGKALFQLPEFDAVVWAFPNDRKLRGLPVLTNAEKLMDVLPEVIAKAFGEEWRIVALASEVVSYVAERACTVRATLNLSNSRTGATALQTLFGKTYCEGEGDAVWQAMQWLWRQQRFLIPRPLWFQPRINTLWQQGLAGRTLDTFDGEELCGWLAKAGATLAEVHRLDVCSWSFREAVCPLEALAAAEDLLVCAAPAGGQKLRLLVGRLTESFGKIQRQPAAILHGDLHLKNFFATDGRVALIDWDNVCAGDPLQELGSFAASLYDRGADAETFLGSFVEAYCAASGWEDPTSALVWHTAAALIYERAQRYVLRLNSDAPRVVDGLIERALVLIEKL
ncbi:MAG TPA: aminoglycoside phosphotransferase family protein [Blastocatellia bacterium]|nr:aminoglycoside phosphotransferase family protein [Blastocatellia bacterium]HMV86971.1 aminoglycoside phosphotransferase family protein [Blastocatellia bacterium]HMX27880.1 aminoglycoside phosphotransferase family protein [Blastocatellia bacterium]HMZ17027.1 aminoglycoside phosphotransferase family protein [Blastocatellia bacterium]HNG33029.1 aminoglycoside phosphotransferase family protein [Blastocatellia bacterium]